MIREFNLDREYGDLLHEMDFEIGVIEETNFYPTLLRSLKFGDQSFFQIDKKFTRAKKNKDGTWIKGEFDVIMYSSSAIALIDIKCLPLLTDLDNLIHKKVNLFKLLHPQYADYTFYLGIAGLAFEEGVIAAAKEHGFGLLITKGENVEIIDQHVRAY